MEILLSCEMLFWVWEWGYFIVLDDFGIGYFCLCYLYEFLCDVFKLDCFFVIGIGMDYEYLVLVCIIDLVCKFKLKIVVEGVEMLV